MRRFKLLLQCTHTFVSRRGCVKIALIDLAQACKHSFAMCPCLFPVLSGHLLRLSELVTGAFEFGTTTLMLSSQLSELLLKLPTLTFLLLQSSLERLGSLRARLHRLAQSLEDTSMTLGLLKRASDAAQRLQNGRQRPLAPASVHRLRRSLLCSLRGILSQRPAFPFVFDLLHEPLDLTR
ncbi:hypothetical protein KC333_g140 [Hortaea werneckii]|nr:hypothetical protein KC333_g140 [Hortaea werneckii]